MPRKPRYFIPGVPSHVVLRGHNRAPCFMQGDDFRYYLRSLRAACRHGAARVHAYVLMTNHIHLLMTPTDDDSIPWVLQSVGRRYVQYVNQTYGRSGTLWEGRYKTSLIDSERYLLTCYRYIELNPVRAGMVRSPEKYRWSSIHANAYGSGDDLVVGHEAYLGLAHGLPERLAVYRALLGEALSEEELHDFRTATRRCLPYGSERFKADIYRRLQAQDRQLAEKSHSAE
jgi:putative transposase